MAWCYRVVEEADEGVKFYGLREVYHDDLGRVQGIAPRRLTARCDSLRQLRDSVKAEQDRWAKMMLAFGEPAIPHTA